MDFPAIIDMAVAVSTTMLVALGDKPARRTRTAATLASTQTPKMQRFARAAPTTAGQRAQAEPVQNPASVQGHPAQSAHDSMHTEATLVDADLASRLIASGATTQPIETVIAVLAGSRDGASINAAAKASGINYRTARRIMEAAAEHQQLATVG